jgi:hypothetical protein
MDMYMTESQACGATRVLRHKGIQCPSYRRNSIVPAKRIQGIEVLRGKLMGKLWLKHTLKPYSRCFLKGIPLFGSWEVECEV